MGATLIDTEKELLGDFFEAWESFHEVCNNPKNKHEKKAQAAQAVVDAAAKVRNFRNPTQDLVADV